MPSARPHSARLVLGGLAALGATPLLAGCAPGGTPSGDTSAVYADGEYTATGQYDAPSGRESVEITLTLADDLVTAVTVVGDARDPNAQSFQRRFADGIDEVVVGIDIDLLEVSRVAGSSLTSTGFNAALASIKSEAVER